MCYERDNPGTKPKDMCKTLIYGYSLVNFDPEQLANNQRCHKHLSHPQTL